MLKPKFFRAFAYFDLVSMWGDVPLVDHELDNPNISWLVRLRLIFGRDRAGLTEAIKFRTLGGKRRRV